MMRKQGFIRYKTNARGVIRIVSVLFAMACCLTNIRTAVPVAAEPSRRWNSDVLDHDSAWYTSSDARAIADSVIQYQSPQGGWPKSTNLAMPPRTPDDIPPPGRGRANSLDNEATTLPMEFLARIIHATGEERYRAAFARGLDYLFAAQYPNGGWPQFWPLREGYYSRITYNDGAMIRVMTLLRDVSSGEAPYVFVDAKRRARAVAAVAKGLDCILRTQIKQNGKLTVWCAQHDEVTLAPADARSYELASLSGSESAGILLYLMSLDKPSSEVIRSVRGGVAWFESTKIEGFRYKRSSSEPNLIEDPSAPPIWARFYELKSNRPFFCDRDGVKKYDIEEIGSERRKGYSWYTNAGEKVAKAYAKWPYSSDLIGHRYRAIVSTDIGGTDPDDFQSMVHLLVYADCFDIEGLISSPYGPGRKEHILEVIDCYAKDFANLKTYSNKYPTPDALRAITKQGETEQAPYVGVRRSTEGSQWIVECARRDDPRPLHVLVWGGIEDLAQALHDAPDILPKLRVYWIGGPNKKWGPDTFQYIATHHPKLCIIESNATYRGWFTGGNQSVQWGNKAFVSQYIAGKGALGDFFISKKDDIKMGDTPSVGWLLRGTPGDPSKPGWGGQFVRAWERPYVRFDRLTTKDDRIEVFGILELVLPLRDRAPEKPEARLVVENQSLISHTLGDGTLRFRFCPKAAKAYSFTIRGNVLALNGKKGGITAFVPPPEVALRPSARLPNWWTDDPSEHVAEGEHIGAKTVSQWREDFLCDFAARMLRCKSPACRQPVNSTEDSAP